MRRPKRREVLAAMAVLVVVPIACSKVLGIEPAHERAENDAGSIIDATPPPDDGALPPLGDKDASCGDTTSDSKNCGACGLDCGGAKCSSGRCEPSVFVYGLLRPTHLALTDEGVYWVDALSSGAGSGVRRCDLTGCPNGMPRTLYETPNVVYTALAVDGETVLAVRSAWKGIDSCNRLGCSGSPHTINVPATSIAFASQKAHYTVASGAPTSSAPPAPGIWRCDNLPYCYDKTHVSPKGTSMQALGGDLYVMDRGATANTGVLLRCVGANCSSPQTLASGLAYAFPRFVASQYGVGWISSNANGIELFMCEPQSCAGGPKTLASLGGWVESFAFDATYLYWANSEYSTIERVRWTDKDAKPEVVLTKQGLPTAIAMREGALYFTRQEFGDIVRWVPPP